MEYKIRKVWVKSWVRVTRVPGFDSAAIADAIDAVPADGWDESTLDQLRSIALELGKSLRAVAAANPRSDD